MNTDIKKLYGPWDPATKALLEKYQTEGRYHPYTFRNDSQVLKVTDSGLQCQSCAYFQDWVLADLLELYSKTGPFLA